LSSCLRSIGCAAAHNPQKKTRREQPQSILPFHSLSLLVFFERSYWLVAKPLTHSINQKRRMKGIPQLSAGNETIQLLGSSLPLAGCRAAAQPITNQKESQPQAVSFIHSFGPSKANNSINFISPSILKEWAGMKLKGCMALG